jgi:hypothetical protein
MRKDIIFYSGAEEIAAMEIIKDLVTCSPVLRPLNYTTHDWPIILTVDSSVTAVGYVLMQIRDDKHCYLSRFGSIAWTEHKSRYSQAKLELYGLFCALRVYRIHIIRVNNLIVEVDAKNLKGMLNNPDIWPNEIHHTAADSLSR